MGLIHHSAIVVTTYESDLIAEAVKKAMRVGLQVLGPCESPINGYWTICIPPDGSMEGWDESSDSDRRRAKFRRWLHEQRYEDGSSPYCWAEIAYGADLEKAEITNHEWMDRMPAK